MKNTLVAAILAATAGTVSAQSFDFQESFAAEENTPGYDAAHLTFAAVEKSRHSTSLTTWMLDADVDGIAPNRHDGMILETGPTEISLYEFVRDSPEGIAYADYHNSYPPGTNWQQVAREYRQRGNEAIVSGSALSGGDS